MHSNKCRKIRTFALFSERIAHVARPVQPVIMRALMESVKVIIFGAIKARVKCVALLGGGGEEIYTHLYLMLQPSPTAARRQLS